MGPLDCKFYKESNALINNKTLRGPNLNGDEPWVETPFFHLFGPWILDTQMTGTYAARVSHAKSLMEGVACQDVGEAELLVVVQGVGL